MQEPITTKAKRRHKQQALIYCLLEESTSDQVSVYHKGEKKKKSSNNHLTLAHSCIHLTITFQLCFIPCSVLVYDIRSTANRTYGCKRFQCRCAYITEKPYVIPSKKRICFHTHEARVHTYTLSLTHTITQTTRRSFI